MKNAIALGSEIVVSACEKELEPGMVQAELGVIDHITWGFLAVCVPGDKRTHRYTREYLVPELVEENRKVFLCQDGIYEAEHVGTYRGHLAPMRTFFTVEEGQVTKTMSVTLDPFHTKEWVREVFRV